MHLKLSIERLGQTYTLKPERVYVVGSSPDCHIVLQSEPQEQSLRFLFDKVAQAWVVEALAQSGMLVGDRPSKHEVLRQPTRIKIRGGFVFSAVPEVAQQLAATGAQRPAQGQSPRQRQGQEQGSFANDFAQALKADATKAFQIGQSVVGEVAQRSADSYANYQQQRQEELERIKTSKNALSWSEFSKKVANSNLFHWFYLTTGLRNTPWLRAYSNQEGSAANFNSFDGYIIPDFHGSVAEVIENIEKQVGSLARYESTDSSVVQLTDGHIADSATQKFLGVELFPIVRDTQKGADYRRFCVTSYHRVKNYLLIEKYGTDLFISWVTRFEPMPAPIMMTVWLSISIVFLSIGFMVSSSIRSTDSEEAIILGFYPLVIWLTCYIFVPLIMENFKIIPKAANFRFIAFISCLFVTLAAIFCGWDIIF